ncbi:energy transducer TonB [Gilvibacter sediminis]|uniref:energy transducer TonB n=1 Tax=Gilvibacter sediminis TaxID=379071 RepID=UPI00235088B7|nr:energy transducer TonB [Gilvibacter sediminis]MDC7997562.1 energy transducer TonB [Gilvibacter sediminis]
MGFLDTQHKRKSFRISSALMAILLLLLFFFGLKYLDPPPEGGIAINFGTSATGSGNVQPQETVRTAPQQTQSNPQQSSKDINEEVVTQDIEDAPVVKDDQKPVETKPAVEEKPVETEKKPDPKPDQSTTDALSSIINGPKNDGKTDGGEGPDATGGDKGDPNGDPNASSYYGTGKGLDGDGNYQLGGRSALNKEKYQQDCNEAGTVVVSIEVDRNGNVISATPGVRGTTNNSRCLLEPAKRAAMDTKFNADPNAPAKQIGKIVYRFSLSN